MRLKRSFFEMDTVTVAQSLIGCKLVRRVGDMEAVAIITETEAYKGAEDPASHAHRGVTPRNKIMFGPPGRLYVYFSYGMHHCMNVVTETDGIPGAVLLRAAQPVSGQDFIRSNRPKAAPAQWMNGPGKLAQAMSINLTFNNLDLTDPDQTSFFLEEGSPLPYQATPRIGISKGTELLWRFVAAPDTH